ncbi:MAG: hypothetical protein IMZ44_18510 [Planctomycetes bacterium]|nr:hypothetical protein [Planctomycetota bacterium]
MTGQMLSHTSRVAVLPLTLLVAGTCGAAGLAVGAPLPGAQEQTPVESRLVPAARVRGVDAKARTLLREGAARSATFRRLLDALEPSDVIVYVETGVLDRPGRLLFVTATAECRFLRISIRVPGRDADLIAWLGHELQHAVEIATVREVREQTEVLGLYRRIGLGDRSHVETAEAQKIWTRVRDEVLYGARAARS